MLLWCFININSSQKITSRHIPRRPKNLKCVDKNLQRNLVWEPPKPRSDELKLEHYETSYCAMASCDPKERLKCYQDTNRTIEVINTASPMCKTSIEQLDAWGVYIFYVEAVFSNTSDKTTVKSKKRHIICKSIKSQMSLSSPSINASSTKDSIQVHSELPTEFVHAQNVSGYEIGIQYSFCLYEGEVSENTSKIGCRYKKCDSVSTFQLLKSGTQYTVEAWFETFGNGKDKIKSKKSIKQVNTKIDPFPDVAKILLCVSLIGFFVFLAIFLFVARYLIKAWKKISRQYPDQFPEILSKFFKDLEANPTRDSDLLNSTNWDVLQRRHLTNQPEQDIDPMKERNSSTGSNPLNGTTYSNSSSRTETTHANTFEKCQEPVISPPSYVMKNHTSSIVKDRQIINFTIKDVSRKETLSSTHAKTTNTNSELYDAITPQTTQRKRNCVIVS
ncbi:uncharacterized protein LOC120334941 [Styela clava]